LIVHPFKNIKTMRKLMLLPVFTLLCGALSALSGQTAPQDAVYLLDAQAYQGLIIEQKPGEHIKLLRQPEGDTLQFEMEQIDRIAKILPAGAPEATAAAPAAPEQRFNQRLFYPMIHGWMGGGDYAFQGLGISVNHRITGRAEAGLGVHYLGQTSDNSPHQRQTIPLTADLRYAFSESRSGRFAASLALSTGYNFTLNREYFDPRENVQVSVSDGWYFSPGLSFRANILPNAGLMLDLGYQLSTSRLDLADGGDQLGRRNWNNFALRAGLFF
jgi:hypothetical protein